MTTLGIIHGVAEVLERSVMVIIDHFCHVVWKRKSAPWGSFRTPRRERLMADIVIISMLYESIGLVSVNDVFFVYQLIYMENESFANLLKSFVIQRSISLMIVWFFHQCISCDRNSLSEHGCHGRLVEKMKNTYTCSNY